MRQDFEDIWRFRRPGRIEFRAEHAPGCIPIHLQLPSSAKRSEETIHVRLHAGPRPQQPIEGALEQEIEPQLTPAARRTILRWATQRGISPEEAFKDIMQLVEDQLHDFLEEYALDRLLGHPPKEDPKLPPGRRVAWMLEQAAGLYRGAMQESLEVPEGAGEEARSVPIERRTIGLMAEDGWIQVLEQRSMANMTAQLSDFVLSLADWSRSRVCYVLDPDLERELAESDPGKVPVRLLEKLPRECTYIAFSQLRAPIGPRNELVNIKGVFIRCARLPGGEPQRLNLTFDFGSISEPLTMPLEFAQGDPDGREEIIQMVARGLGLLKKDPEVALEPIAFNLAQQVMARCCMPVISALLYLSSPKADVQDAPPQRGPAEAARALQGRRQREVHEVEAGYRIGAAIRQARRQERQEQGEDSGRTVRPHMRAGHWKVVWHGPRAKPHPVATWIMPTAVLGGGQDVVDRPVKQAGEKPS